VRIKISLPKTQKTQQNAMMRKKKQGVCHTVSDLAIYIKKYLKGKKKNYGNSNVSLVTQKNII
jgi:hypothetical protein